MEKTTVAVVGAGPSGLTMLKQLREDGFSVTLYERRPNVGGLWAFSANKDYTIALPRTHANISKFTCGFSDYPIPDKYPTYMRPHQYQEFMEEYAIHFDLMKDIVFNTTVTLATRNKEDTKWLVEMESSGKSQTVEFDKVVFCHGYQSTAKIPTFGGEEKFEGTITHSQQYRSPEEYKGKNVLVLGLTSTAGDIVPDIIPHASKVYIAHRRGALPYMRYRNGTPADLMVTWRRRKVSHWLQQYLPSVQRALGDAIVSFVGNRAFGKLDPKWRLAPFPSVTLVLPGSWEFLFPFLKDGSLESTHGIRRYLGPKSIELLDGTVLDDIDSVIYCTGYRADWTVAPWLETSAPAAHAYAGPPIYRLYMNIFPPRHADSIAFLCYSAFGKSNGFSFGDVTAMAISNTWRGLEALPPAPEMERRIDEHQAWVAGRWKQDPTTDTSCVKQYEFQGWLHRAAGTGMENLGWGWKGWAFWLRDREMSRLMNDGVETAHMYRYFETGKRKTWPGAREEIIRVNEYIKTNFPTKDTKFDFD